MSSEESSDNRNNTVLRAAAPQGRVTTVLAMLLAAVWVCVIAYAWSPKYYWPDADGYTMHVSQGHWVAHPPGYALFVILGRLIHLSGVSPYMSVQWASLLLAIAGLVVIYFLTRQFIEPARAVLVVAFAGFSWVVLLTAQTGTSHAADLFTVSLLLWTAVRLPGSAHGNAWRNDALFGLALVICAGFRLNTFLMMAPLYLAVLCFNMRRVSFWVCCASAFVLIVAFQAWVIDQSGGFQAYSSYSASMHEGNSQNSLLLSGVTPRALLNILRALLWFSLGCVPFAALCLPVWRSAVAALSRPALIYGLTTSFGCLVVVASYLCTHPSFVIPAIPGFALSTAVLLSADNSYQRVPRGAVTAAIAIVFMFLLMRPFAPPRMKWQAVANGILLQYAAPSSRAAIFKTTARWLEEGGFGEDLSERRIKELRSEDEWRRRVQAYEKQ